MSIVIAWVVAAIVLVALSLIGTWLLRKKERQPPPWHASRIDYEAIPRSDGRRREAQDSRSMSRSVWPDVESVLPSMDEFDSRARARPRKLDIDLPGAPFKVQPRPAAGVAVAEAPVSAPAPRGVARVLTLHPADEAAWAAASPLELSSLQLATLSAALFMPAGNASAHADRTLALRFPPQSILRMARSDSSYMNSLAAQPVNPDAAAPEATIEAKGATAVASTLLAVAASERHLEAVRAELHDLRAILAALPARADSQAAEQIKAAGQELARFVRDARDNTAWAIATPALRGRIADAAAHALQLWRELLAEIDTARQRLERIAAANYFSDAQLIEATPLLLDVGQRRSELEALAGVIAGLQHLRLALGDAPPPRSFDPLQSVAAMLGAGGDRDAAVLARLLTRIGDARNDFYVGKAEFEEKRAALRTLIAEHGARPVAPAVAWVEAGAAAVTRGFPASDGSDDRWLFRIDRSHRVSAVRKAAA